MCNCACTRSGKPCVGPPGWGWALETQWGTISWWHSAGSLRHCLSYCFSWPLVPVYLTVSHGHLSLEREQLLCLPALPCTWALELPRSGDSAHAGGAWHPRRPPGVYGNQRLGGAEQRLCWERLVLSGSWSSCHDSASPNPTQCCAAKNPPPANRQRLSSQRGKRNFKWFL